MPDLYQIMPFLKTQSGNRPRTNGVGSRETPTNIIAILNRPVLLRNANCCTLARLCAVTQGGKHRPPTPDVTADKSARKGQNARNQN